MDCDVVVIGAGAAGLAAARSLARKSLKVIVLEARDRIGGRVWSRVVKGVSTPVELGGEFIHGDAPETIKLLRESGLEAIPTGDESWACGNNGDLRPEVSDFSATARAIFDRARSLSDDTSVDQFLQRLEANESIREQANEARAFVEGFEAADPAVASVKAIAAELRSGVDSASARPSGGYGPMFERLRRDCVAASVQINLSTVVRRISWQRRAVTVDADNHHAQASAVCARAVIVTVPIGLLNPELAQSVRFEPDLPREKRQALGNLEMGHAVKLAMWFRTAFWQTVADGRYRNAAFLRCEGQRFAAYWTQFPIHGELIIAWAGGPKATALAAASQAELVHHALNGLGNMFNAPALVLEEFAGMAAHDWSRDPFARGAYSYVAVGGGDARAALATPVDDTLFFAGEATSTDGQGGTVNGALATGERAALEAAASLSALSG